MVPASLDDKFVIRFCVCAQNATDADIHYAYEIISGFASDLHEILRLDEKANREEEEYLAKAKKVSLPSEATEETPAAAAQREDDESVDEVFVLDRKKKMSLRYKRSFFVRMVSDPKLYNPKIVKASTTRSTSERDSDDPEANNDDGVVTPL
jgi:aromatic-L-amino-acid decarboxylase